MKMIRGKSLSGEVFNIGSNDEITILKLADTIKKLTNSRSKLIHKPARVDDPKRRSADISKAWKILKWKPRIPLNQGLMRTAQWFSVRS